MISTIHSQTPKLGTSASRSPPTILSRARFAPFDLQSASTVSGKPALRRPQFLASTMIPSVARSPTSRWRRRIPMNELLDFRPLLVDSLSVSGFATTSWGEHARARLRGAQTDGRLSMLAYGCPAGFGPARHLHREDDEILLIERGTIAVWTPHECRTAGPGDVIMLPKRVPHTWRAYGDDPIRFQVIVTPGEFEPFFELIVERNLTLADQAALVAVASAT